MAFHFSWQVLEMVEAHEAETRRRDEENEQNWENVEDEDDPTIPRTDGRTMAKASLALRHAFARRRKTTTIGTKTITKRRLSPAIHLLVKKSKEKRGYFPPHWRTPLPIVGRWNDVIWATILAVKAAAESGGSPQFDPENPAVFNSYWYEVFSFVALAVADDETIPEYVTMPPVLAIPVRFNDGVGWTGMKKCPPDCPHCNMAAPPHLMITKSEDAGPVTKVDLVLAVREYMYGRELNSAGDTVKMLGMQLVRGPDWYAPRPGSLLYGAQWQLYDFYRPSSRPYEDSLVAFREDEDGLIAHWEDEYVEFGPAEVSLLTERFSVMCSNLEVFELSHEQDRNHYMDGRVEKWERLMEWLRGVDYEWEDVDVVEEGGREGDVVDQD